MQAVKVQTGEISLFSGPVRLQATLSQQRQPVFREGQHCIFNFFLVFLVTFFHPRLLQLFRKMVKRCLAVRLTGIVDLIFYWHITNQSQGECLRSVNHVCA